MSKKKSSFTMTVDEWGHIETTLELCRENDLSSFITELGRSQGVFINMRINGTGYDAYVEDMGIDNKQ